jgi:formate hydrogenlyase subunit 3/multisubunit Na+/H+ antiporter MnhD subunit
MGAAGRVHMSGVHLHLLLNHVPVLGTIICFLVLLIARIRSSRDLTWLALAGTVVTALITIPVYMTGEPAEDVAKTLPGVTRPIIHEHEEAAEYAIIFMEITGAVALASMLMGRRRDIPRPMLTATLVLLLFVTTVMARTAYLGGQVRHTEIRAGAPAAADDRD